MAPSHKPIRIFCLLFFVTQQAMVIQHLQKQLELVQVANHHQTTDAPFLCSYQRNLISTSGAYQSFNPREFLLPLKYPNIFFKLLNIFNIFNILLTSAAMPPDFLWCFLAAFFLARQKYELDQNKNIKDIFNTTK